ncbi:MAG: hypothetical protein DI563_15970 [Variovorax paradoxus]|uniref:Uncharacterized protein n=1 Tax=Variovorax paradoxus TaxID=34073 RepID=A0A2W5Q437_VARPD|nr:MAG: hypothetical protein DI563_15970 [Variovorax paradoxus]
MSQFASKQFEGKTYTFEHLQPMGFALTLNVRGQAEPHPLAIDITFGSHCFTEAFDATVHGDHHRYTHQNELRAFDTQRYACSLHLPQVMKSITSGMIYKSDENYTYVSQIKVEDGDARLTDYSIFFSLNRPAGDDRTIPASRLLLYVKSGYPTALKPRGPNARNWRFKALASERAGIGR